MSAGQVARRMWTLFEPVHAVTYFAAEARAAFEAAGLRGFWRGYFAGRAAPLGPVAAAPVTASANAALPGPADPLARLWHAAATRLAGRGVLGADGSATEQGAALRAAVERATDVAAARPWHDQELAAGLAEVLRPIALACSAGLPALNPVGVPRPEQAGPDQAGLAGADR